MFREGFTDSRTTPGTEPGANTQGGRIMLTCCKKTLITTTDDYIFLAHIKSKFDYAGDHFDCFLPL